MENDIDKITKDLLADSKLELNNPHFTSMILSEISAELERKTKRRIFIMYLFLFLMLTVAACLVIVIFNIDVINPFANPASFLKIIQNGYCILPILLLLIGKKIFTPGIRYRVVRQP